MADGDHDHTQFTIVDFINDPVIADSHAPRRSPLELLYVGGAWVGFELPQTPQNPRPNVVGQPVEFLLDRLGQDYPIPHFRFRDRAARYSASVANRPEAISAAALGRAAS